MIVISSRCLGVYALQYHYVYRDGTGTADRRGHLVKYNLVQKYNVLNIVLQYLILTHVHDTFSSQNHVNCD